MKLRLSIWTMLIAGSLLSVPTTQAGQIPLKNEPLERQTDENLNMKRYVAAGDRAYVVGVQDGSLVPDVSLNPNGIGWHITGQMGGVWAHPIKLLHQFQFFLNGNLLPAATKFVSGEGYGRSAVAQLESRCCQLHTDHPSRKRANSSLSMEWDHAHLRIAPSTGPSLF